MEKNDMIIVSVDDHVVEPPDMFERHLPAKYRDLAPRVVHKDDGTDVWDFQGMEIPNIGLNAVAGAHPRSTGSTRRPSTRSGPAASMSRSGCST